MGFLSRLFKGIPDYAKMPIIAEIPVPSGDFSIVIRPYDDALPASSEQGPEALNVRNYVMLLKGNMPGLINKFIREQRPDNDLIISDKSGKEVVLAAVTRPIVDINFDPIGHCSNVLKDLGIIFPAEQVEAAINEDWQNYRDRPIFTPVGPRRSASR